MTTIENEAKYIAEQFYNKDASRFDLLQFICNRTKNGVTFKVEYDKGDLLFTLRNKSIATMRISSDMLYAATLRNWYDKLNAIMSKMKEYA